MQLARYMFEEDPSRLKRGSAVFFNSAAPPSGRRCSYLAGDLEGRFLYVCRKSKLYRPFTMTQYQLLFVLSAACLGVAVFAAILYFAPVLLRPESNRGTKYVAEVWLICEGGRGSTMYRQRFETMFMASVFAKLYAFVLDLHLPTHYTVFDGGGKKVRVAHDFGIRYKVRQTTLGESGSFIEPLWTTVLPGERSFAGEPAYRHPVSKQEAAEHEHYPVSIA